MRRLAGLVLLVAACGGGQRDVVPRLPGDGSDNTAAPREAGGAETDLWAGRDTIDAPRPLAPRPIAMPPVERFQLGNGLQVIAVESRFAPTVQVQLALKAGWQTEPRDKVGLARFVASMLPKGARGRSGAAISSALEQAGAQLSSNASFEALLVSCHAPAAGQSACFKAVGDMMIAPSFPGAAMKEVREQLGGVARANQQDMTQLANQHFQNALWGDEHVRGWPMTEATVGAIQRPDLVAWHRAHASPKNAVLLVVSGRKPAALRGALESAFGPWRGNAPKPASMAAAPELKGIRIRLVDIPGARQAQIRVGRPGLAHRDPDFYAATVVNQILGGGERSRLGRAMRRAQGGQSNASTTFDRNLERGAFVAAGVAPAGRALPVARMLMDQIGQMASEGPREQEVQSAASELAGSYMTRLTSHQEIGSALLAAELHGMGPDYVRDYAVELAKVDVSAARASAARWLDGKNLVVVVAGSAQTIEPQLVDAGLRFDKVSVGAAVAAAPQVDAGKGAPAVVDPKKEAAARAILDGALGAKGGAGRLAGVKSMSWKGKATLKLPGGQVPAQVEKRFVAPDKLRLDMVIEMSGSKMSITTVLAGDKGWAQEIRPDGVNTIDFPPSEIEAGKAQIWRDQDFVLLRHREKGARVAPLDDVELDGAPHHAIQVTSADGKRQVTLLVDKKTRRLGGMSYAEHGIRADESFGDYKAVKGLEFARRRTTKSAQVDLTTEVTDVVVNPTIDPSIFVKPAAAPAPRTVPTPGGKPAPGTAPTAPTAPAPRPAPSTAPTAPTAPAPRPSTAPTRPAPGTAPARPAPSTTPAPKPAPGK